MTIQELRCKVANHLQDTLGNDALDQPWVGELMGLFDFAEWPSECKREMWDVVSQGRSLEEWE